MSVRVVCRKGPSLQFEATMLERAEETSEKACEGFGMIRRRRRSTGRPFSVPLYSPVDSGFCLTIQLGKTR